MSAGGDLGYVGQWKRPAGLLTRAGVEVKRFESLASSVRDLYRAFAHGTAWCYGRGKTREKRQVSGCRWQDRMSWSSTVYGRAPRSLRTPVAARLLPGGARLSDHRLNHPAASSPRERGGQRPIHPVALGSIPDSIPNIRSLACHGGDLARPGPGPADCGAAEKVRRAARRRPGHRQRGGRERRALRAPPTARGSGA
jgi:hypothetical protein